MGDVINFLQAINDEGYYMVTLNEINEPLVVFDIPSAIERVKKISVKCILDTYFQEIIFKSENGNIYEIIVL